jgi:hypothetical protein
MVDVIALMIEAKAISHAYMSLMTHKKQLSYRYVFYQVKEILENYGKELEAMIYRCE